MPIIPPAALPLFIKRKVLKRKGLLEQAAKTTLTAGANIGKSLLEAIPTVHSRNLNSTWNRQIVYSGRLNSCSQGIAMITFLPEKDPIILFNWNWAKVKISQAKISHGKFYLNSIAKKSLSLFFTCTLSQFATVVLIDPTIPLELKNLVLAFKAHDKKPKTPTEILRKELAQTFEEIRKKLKLKKIPFKVKNEYIRIVRKANKMRDPQALKREIKRKLEKNLVELAGIDRRTYIETKRSIKDIRQIYKGNVSSVAKRKIKRMARKTELVKSLLKPKKQIRKMTTLKIGRQTKIKKQYDWMASPTKLPRLGSKLRSNPKYWKKRR